MDDSERQRRVVLGSRLRAARMGAHVTAVHAARTLGIRRAAIHEMESGARCVRADELWQLADLYGVGATYLMERKTMRTREERAEHVAQLLAGLSDGQLERLSEVILILRRPLPKSDGLYSRRQ